MLPEYVPRWYNMGINYWEVRMYEESEKVIIGFGGHAIDCLYGSSSIGGWED